MIERACGLEYGYAAVGKLTNLGMLQGYIRPLSTGPDLLVVHNRAANVDLERIPELGHRNLFMDLSLSL